MLDYLRFFFTKLLHLRDDDFEEKYYADQVEEPIGDKVEDGSWPWLVSVVHFFDLTGVSIYELDLSDVVECF